MAIVLLVAVGLALVEWAYVARSIPFKLDRKDFQSLARKGDLLVLGDSRADVDVDPETLGRALGYPRAVNVADAGKSPINQMQLLSMMDLDPAFLVIVVSPASVYGTFYRNPKAVRKDLERERKGDSLSKIIHTPYDYSEPALSNFAKAHLHLARGFNGLRAILAGHVNRFWDERGWDHLADLGDNRNYVALINLDAYRANVLNTGKGIEDERDKAFREAYLALCPAPQAVLVRTPCSPEIRALEDGRFPDFDARMERLASSMGLFFWPPPPDFTPDWSRADGSHLTVEQAAAYTRRLVQAFLRQGAKPQSGLSQPSPASAP